MIVAEQSTAFRCEPRAKLSVGRWVYSVLLSPNLCLQTLNDHMRASFLKTSRKHLVHTKLAPAPNSVYIYIHRYDVLSPGLKETLCMQVSD